MTYIMGNGDVIKGCEIGTMKMCKGEKRYIVIPPDLAYGSEPYGQIPASMTSFTYLSKLDVTFLKSIQIIPIFNSDSTLTFEITLTDVQDDPFSHMFG